LTSRHPLHSNARASIQLPAREILRFAADEASVRDGCTQRPLAVLAAEDDTPEWAELGFDDTGGACWRCEIRPLTYITQ
jgi:hypothetical protein